MTGRTEETLKEGLQEFSKSIINEMRRDYGGDEFPEKEIYFPSERGFEKGRISAPHELFLQDDGSLPKKYDSEVQKEMFNILSHGQKSDNIDLLATAGSDNIDLDDDLSELDDVVALSLSSSLTGLIRDICLATGDLDFTEEAFEIAYRSFREFTLQKPRDFRIIIPLVNFRSEAGKISLSPENSYSDLQQSNLQRSNVFSIEIRELTSEEKCGIYTALGKDQFGRGINKNPPLQYAAVIKMTGYTISIPDSVYESITTALRLFSPNKPGIRYSQIHTLWEGPLYLRKGIYDWTSSKGEEFPKQYPTSGSEYKFNESESKEFFLFWERYSEYLDVSDDAEFSNALKRLDETYAKRSKRDQLIDAVIGTESTLLKDLGTQSSITFRLKARSGILLESHVTYDRKEIGNILQSLYFARGEIVHSDRSLDEIFHSKKFQYEWPEEYEDESTGVKASHFVRVSRIALANTIKAYMDFRRDRDMSMTEANQKLDELLLSASTLGVNNRNL